MQTNIEQTILRNLLTDEKYMRKVLPFIKPDYFQGVYKRMAIVTAGPIANFILTILIFTAIFSIYITKHLYLGQKWDAPMLSRLRARACHQLSQRTEEAK